MLVSMENHHNHVQANHALHSPNSTSGSSSSNSSSSSNGAAAASSTPISIPRSIDSSPYPTTFVQADTSSFKQVVQMLTGSAGKATKRPAEAPPPPHKNPLPPAAKATVPKKPAFKLYDRRNSFKNLKMMSPLIPSFVNSNGSRSPMGSMARRQQHQPEILSPSVLDFPSLALSPVTPLISDPFNRTPHAGSWTLSLASPEARAIAEKGFYLHPSPRSAEPPRLLPLFPETSPRLATASAATTT